MEKLYILDASGYLYRSYFAIRQMTNAKGMPKSECPRIPPSACSVVPNLGNRAAHQFPFVTLKRELQPVCIQRSAAVSAAS